MKGDEMGGSNLDTLLRPISPGRPAGEDLRTDHSANAVYFKLKDARNGARALERGSESQGEVQAIAPGWMVVLELAPQVLAERSKDLEVAAWLIEAMCRTTGFAGLRDGFALVAALVETFWDDLYPRPDEEGIATRVAPLTGLNGEDGEGTLISPIRSIRITEGEVGYPAWAYFRALELAKVADAERRERLASTIATLEQVEADARTSPDAFYRGLTADIDGAIEAYARLNAALDARCGPDAPRSSQIRNILQDIRDAVTVLARQATPDAPASDGEAGAGTAALASPAAYAPGPAGSITSREQAFDRLLEIARFFERTEPQAPIAYTLFELVRRGRLPLPALLEELIPDAGARRLFLTTAGMRISE